MDVLIVIVVSGLALALHGGLFVLIRRWMDRDLALSFSDGDAAKQAYMLRQLRLAKQCGVRRRDLPERLEAMAATYTPSAAESSSPCA